MLELFTKHGKLPKNLIVMLEMLKVIPSAVKIIKIDNYKLNTGPTNIWHMNNVKRCAATHKIIDRR